MRDRDVDREINPGISRLVLILMRVCFLSFLA
jgi:hypothetical protein